LLLNFSGFQSQKEAFRVLGKIAARLSPYTFFYNFAHSRNGIAIAQINSDAIGICRNGLTVRSLHHSRNKVQQGSKFPKDIVPAANFGDEKLLHVYSPGAGFSAAIRCARFHNGSI
jgi:hypothetical protein